VGAVSRRKKTANLDNPLHTNASEVIVASKVKFCSFYGEWQTVCKVSGMNVSKREILTGVRNLSLLDSSCNTIPLKSLFHEMTKK